MIMHTRAIPKFTRRGRRFSDAARKKLLRAVANLRAKLVRRYERVFPHRAEMVRASIAEAEALAWETSFPHLFLPLLAHEKVSRALATEGAEQRRLAVAA